MPLPRTQRLRRTDAAPDSLGIGPEEYFLLSRVEGSPTVGDVLGSSGLPPAEAERILTKLVEVGALEKIDGEPTTKRSAPTRPQKPLNLKSPGLRQRADSRRKLLLQQQFGAVARPPGEQGHDEDDEIEVDAAAAPEPDPVEPVPISDERVEPALAISVDEQRRVLALIDRYEDLTPFELLGLYPTNDEKRIKRAYFDSSRRLHPDTYYGKHLGPFKPLLDKLFARAKQAYAELRKPDVRRPYVVVYEAQQAEKEAKKRAEQEAKDRADTERRAAERDKMRATRLAREKERAQRKVERERDKVETEVETNLLEATRALEVGNLARASNFFRLALQADPDNEEIREQWEQTRAKARKERAGVAYTRALQYLELGQVREAILMVCEAADGDPTAEHLAHAADLLRESDVVRAREYALKGLERLNVAMDREKPAFDATTATHLRVQLGRTFLAAGQTSTAKELAKQAKEDRPDDPEVRALLKSLKVT